MDINETLRDAEFKDERPLKTVETIKKILETYGIQTTEYWYESGVPHCYSIRITVNGTNFGTNGKGLTKEFALASGYGELMERLQLGYIGSKDVQKDGMYSRNDTQDVCVSAKDLFSKNQRWYESLSDVLYRYTEVRETPETLLMQYADENGMIFATPYYNCVKDCTEYFPSALRKRVYTANGCAAGNSMEEAVVQGISEIVERNHQLRIVSESLALPDVPEEVLRRYKTAYEIISHVRDMGFKVAIKDCSLGTKYPVVCAIFVDSRTGKYHTHFGAYPIFEIALERALTETLQGQNIMTVGRFEDFSYQRSDVHSINSLANELTQGTWTKSPNFFVGQSPYSYHEDIGFAGTNNAELFKECIAFFAAQGYDVLVRNCSCLGFHTYQILIPGYSEVFAYRLSKKLDDNRFCSYALKTLRNPSKASIQDIMGTFKHIKQINQLGKNITDIHGFLASAKLSANLSSSESFWLMSSTLAHICYTLGQYGEVVKHVQNMIAQPINDNMEELKFLVCLKRYFSMLQNKISPEQAREVINYFHDEKTAKKLFDCIDQGCNPLEDYVLHCDMSCTENCRLYGKCLQKRANELCELIERKTAELDFTTFAQTIRSALSR